MLRCVWCVWSTGHLSKAAVDCSKRSRANNQEFWLGSRPIRISRAYHQQLLCRLTLPKMDAFPTCTQPSNLGPSSDLASVGFASSAQNAGTSGRKQACAYCRQRKRKCDVSFRYLSGSWNTLIALLIHFSIKGRIPNCSTCIKNRVRCSYILPTAPSNAGENQVGAPGHGNTPASDPEHLPIASSAATLSGLFPMNPEAAFWNPSTTMAWDAGVMHNFLPQHSVLPSSNLQNEASLQPSQLLQYPPSTPNYIEGIQTTFQMQENSHPGEPARGAVNSIFGRGSLGRNVSSGTQLREDSFSNSKAAIQIDDLSQEFNLPPEISSSNGENMVSPQVRARHSSNISNSLEPRSPSSELDRTSETCTVSLQKTARLAESEDLLPSVSHILELLDIFFNYYHNYLPCIHRKTLTERVKSRLESAQSSPLLWAVLAVAAPAHPNLHLQALQSRWLAKARSTFDTNLNSSTFPTQSLQAAVFIIFQAYISADLTDAWFFLGKSCRLANLLGIDRVDCTRSERLISLAPRPRDAIETEEQRKTIWALFFLDRSLSCLAGFSLAIDDRNYQVNFPLEDELFQNSTCNVSIYGNPN